MMAARSSASVSKSYLSRAGRNGRGRGVVKHAAQPGVGESRDLVVPLIGPQSPGVSEHDGRTAALLGDEQSRVVRGLDIRDCLSLQVRGPRLRHGAGRVRCGRTEDAAVPSARALPRPAAPPWSQAAPADLRPRPGLADRVSAVPDPRAGTSERLGPDHIWVSRIVRQVIGLSMRMRFTVISSVSCHVRVR
jgi:hypothetical protein